MCIIYAYYPPNEVEVRSLPNKEGVDVRMESYVSLKCPDSCHLADVGHIEYCGHYKQNLYMATLDGERVSLKSKKGLYGGGGGVIMG